MFMIIVYLFALQFALIITAAVPMAIKGRSFFIFTEHNTSINNKKNMAEASSVYVSLEVAVNTFPLGTGFGTFASWTSGIYYSPVYQLYGILF